MKIFTLQNLWNYNHAMKSNVVAFEEELKSTSKKTIVREENLGKIAGTSHWNSLKDMDVSMATKHDASANEKTTISKSVPFDDVGRVVSCFPFPPYVYTSTITSQSKATFTRKEQSTPQCICPVLRFWHHRKWRFRWAGVNGTYRTSRQENNQHYVTSWTW